MQTETGVIIHNVSKKRYLQSLKLLSTFQQKKSRQYTTVILTFLALIIFGVFAINPTITTILELQKQLEDSKALDRQLDEKIVSLQTLQVEYEALKPDLPILESAFPVTPETPVLIGQIQSLIQDNNLRVDEVQMKSVPYTKEGLPQGEVGSYLVLFNISGSYEDINNFSNALVAFNRLVTLDQVTVLRDTQDTSLIRSTAEVRAYFDQKPL